jgi:hypothetical protein
MHYIITNNLPRPKSLLTNDIGMFLCIEGFVENIGMFMNKAVKQYLAKEPTLALLFEIYILTQYD